MTNPDLTHFARPGPGYWDYRCLKCDYPVAAHVGWKNLIWRWT